MARNEIEAHSGEGQDVFEDAPLDYTAIRGTRTFENVLYSEEHAERNVPINVITGEKARQIEGSVERAKAFVSDDPRRVAVPEGTGPMIETQSALYISTVFYDSKVVRGNIVRKDEYGQLVYENDGYDLEWTYRAAVQSDDYVVELVEADYESGDVTIRVTEMGHE